MSTALRALVPLNAMRSASRRRSAGLPIGIDPAVAVVGAPLERAAAGH